MGHSFIAKLLVGAGPHPSAELADLLAQAASDERQEARAIFATLSNDGGGFAKEKNVVSTAVVLCPVQQGRTTSLDGFVADIRFVFKQRPTNIPAVYGDPWVEQIAGWWQLDRVQRFRPGVTLEDVPGTSSGAARATKSFAGNRPFSYWNFGTDPRLALCAPATSA